MSVFYTINGERKQLRGNDWSTSVNTHDIAIHAANLFYYNLDSIEDLPSFFDVKLDRDGTFLGTYKITVVMKPDFIAEYK